MPGILNGQTYTMLCLQTANSGGLGVSGDVLLRSGSASRGNSGRISLATGLAADGAGGDVKLRVGKGVPWVYDRGPQCHG